MPKSKSGDITNAVDTIAQPEKGSRIGPESAFLPVSHHPAFSQDSALQQQIQVPNDEAMRWQMRWWLFRIGIIFSFVWMILMIGLSIYVFSKAGSIYSLFISAASAPAIEFIRRFTNYLLPMDEKQYFLAIKEIEVKGLKYSNTKQRDESNTQTATHYSGSHGLEQRAGVHPVRGQSFY